MVEGIGSRVYILGIGGISLSAIARILKENGHEVSGYDKVKSEITEKLKFSGIKVSYSLKIKEMLKEIDTIIYTSAIMETCEELVWAKNFGVQVLSRAEALEKITLSYNNIIAVSGSHGKTTTTAIISTIFDHLNGDLTAHVGGEMVEYDSNCIIKGARNFFITEACEYKRNFLRLAPNIGVILNLDLDHTDVYKDEDEMLIAFISFSNKIKAGGVLVINKSAKGAERVIKKTNKNKRIITFSVTDNDAEFYLKNIEKVEDGFAFEVWCGYKKYGDFKFPRGGEHNLSDALSAIIVADAVGFKQNKIGEALKGFKGVKRRYEKIGFINGAEVILDYAHHPEEIIKVIKETKSETKGKVFAVFQPHTYTRTKSFWSGFIKALSKADSIVLFPIYPAREKAIRGVTSERMAKDLRTLKRICYYNESIVEIKTYLEYFVKPCDKVLILGAGDIASFKNLLN